MSIWSFALRDFTSNRGIQFADRENQSALLREKLFTSRIGKKVVMYTTIVMFYLVQFRNDYCNEQTSWISLKLAWPTVTESILLGYICLKERLLSFWGSEDIHTFTEQFATLGTISCLECRPLKNSHNKKTTCKDNVAIVI